MYYISKASNFEMIEEQRKTNQSYTKSVLAMFMIDEIPERVIHWLTDEHEPTEHCK